MDECLLDFQPTSDSFTGNNPSQDQNWSNVEAGMFTIISTLCRSSPISFESAKELVLDAMSRVNRTSGSAERIAETAAAGTVLPPRLFSRDVTELKEHGSLENLIRHRQSEMSSNRFNLNRFNNLYQDDPEADRLRVLATSCARIDTAEDFIPIPEPEPTRSLLLKVPNTIRSHIRKLWDSGNVLVLPLSAILTDNPHTSSLHIVFQNSIEKPLGRILGDLTNRKPGNAINSREAKPAIIARYGDLYYPTIMDMVQDEITVADKVGGFQNVRMFKEDVVGAFGQFNFDPRDARLLAFMFAMDFVIIYMTGLFGWSSKSLLAAE